MNTIASPWLGEVTLAQGPVELTRAPEAWTIGDLTAWLASAMPQLEVRPDCANVVPEGFLDGLKARTLSQPLNPKWFPFFPANISSEEGDYIRSLHTCFFAEFVVEPLIDDMTQEFIPEDVPQAWTIEDLSRWITEAESQIAVRPGCSNLTPAGFLEGLSSPQGRLAVALRNTS